MSIVKKLAGETIIYGLGAVLPKVLNFVVLGVYLTRILSRGDYGKHGLLYSYVALMMVFATFRMETAFFRFANKKEYNSTNAFSTAFISVSFFTLLIFVGSLLFAQPLATLLNIPDNPEFVRYFAWIILFDALAAPAFARLRIENRPMRFSVVKILNVVVNIVLIVFFLEISPWLNKTHPSWVSWFYDSSKELDYVFWANLGASAAVLLLLTKEIVRDKLGFDKELFSKMLKYAFPLIIVGIAAVINGLSDKYFLTELLPGSLDENMDIAGIYNGSLKIAVIMSLFTTAFNYAAEPFFFKQANTVNSNKDNAYAKVALAFSAVGSFIFLGVLLYIDIFKFLIGESFREAIDIVPVLLLSYLILGMFYNFAIWYKITDKTYMGAIIASIGSIIVIGLNIYLIPKLGYIGSAWSMLGCYGFMTIASYMLGQRYHPIPYPIFKIILNIVVAILLYIVSLQLTSSIDSMPFKLSLNTLFILSYVAFIYKYEWKEVMS